MMTPEFISPLDAEMANLIHVSWVILIPLGVLLCLVLYKIFLLLQSVYEFWTLARHELSPAMQDLRKTANHVEVLTSKAVGSVNTVERGVQASGPILQRGLDVIRQSGVIAKNTTRAIAQRLIQAVQP